MQSTRTSAAPRRRGQRGSVSLVEALVASALLGIVGMVGLTAWETAINSSRTAVRLAWAQCMVRSELDAILASPWYANGYRSADPTLMSVSVTPVRTAPTQGQEQEILVVVRDPQTGDILYQAAALKVYALQGSAQKDIQVQDGILTDVTFGCPAP
jgi:hypothetical protein